MVSLLTPVKFGILHLTTEVLCPICGNPHPGICPRIAEIRFDPTSGSIERLVFWDPQLLGEPYQGEDRGAETVPEVGIGDPH